MIARPTYMNTLKKYQQQKLIKVITGVRRCGKSFLLNAFAKQLHESGVRREQITIINFEDMSNDWLRNKDNLHQYLVQKLIPGEINYVFLDEVQRVTEFEKVADSLYIRDNVDLYLTGSNAYFLSSDLATLLTGRYVEIKMWPFSFAEYVSAFANRERLDLMFNDYLQYGSFPQSVILLQNDKSSVDAYLEGLLNTILLNDVVPRKGVGDKETLQRITGFMFDNVGNITTANGLAKAMTARGWQTSNHTVSAYLTALLDAFLLYRLGRYDVRGRKLLDTQEKYYLVDPGLRRVRLGQAVSTDYGRMLENVIYLELLRRSGKVFVGKGKDGEIDFVVQNNDGSKHYYQVAQTIKDPITREREVGNLAAISDHYPKTVITLDAIEPPELGNGIRHQYALDWLLN